MGPSFLLLWGPNILLAALIFGTKMGQLQEQFYISREYTKAIKEFFPQYQIDV
jgi:hypothetical protein